MFASGSARATSVAFTFKKDNHLPVVSSASSVETGPVVAASGAMLLVNCCCVASAVSVDGVVGIVFIAANVATVHDGLLQFDNDAFDW